MAISATTRTSTYTIVHTAAYLSQIIMGTAADILAALGVPLPDQARWERLETAISTWVAERSLLAVIVECHRPSGTTDPIFEFPVTYRASGEGDATFTNQRASLARYRAKFASVPRGTTFELICSLEDWHRHIDGWATTSRASTTGMTSFSVSSVGSGPGASASLRWHTGRG